MTGKPSLDDALAAWAGANLPDCAGDEEALARILSHADAVTTTQPGLHQHRPWWMLGGAVAASIALALVLVPRPTAGPGTDVGAEEVMLASADPDSSAAFALLYTPTIEEEAQL